MAEERSSEPGRAFVTGAGGFIGSHLVRSLAANGGDVTAVIRPGSNPARLNALAGQITIVEADITDRGDLASALATSEPTTVYHLAGDTSVRKFAGEWDSVERAERVNVGGTLNLIRAIAESAPSVRCLVRAGGLEEYGDGKSPSAESQREQPVSPYSASQTAATHWCQVLQPNLEFGIVTLRPALIYGPGQDSDFLVPALIRALVAGQPFAISDGSQIRDYLYIDDLIEALLRAGERGASLGGSVINICSAEQYRVADVASAIAEAVGRPELLTVAGVRRRTVDLDNVSGLNERAAELLGWNPRTTLSDGLGRTIAWHRMAGIA